MKHLVIPFDIIYDAGFVATSYEQPFCGFTTTPTANHGATAKGHYVVWMSYSVNNITRTASYSFNL